MAKHSTRGRMGSAMLLVCFLATAAATRTGVVATANAISSSSRSLLVTPMVLPAPFASPQDIKDAVGSARAAGGVSTLASSLCSAIARSDNQRSREYRDTDGVKLYPMFHHLSLAAYLYPETIGVLAQALEQCNAKGGAGAEGVGYGIAYMFNKGVMEALGVTQILETIYDKTGSCKDVNNILDVAAAVINSRNTALDELHIVMGTYSKKLQTCTPKDAQQRYHAVSLQGEESRPKARRGSSSLAKPDHMPTQQPAGAGAKAGAAAGSDGSSSGLFGIGKFFKGLSKGIGSGAVKGPLSVSVAWERAKDTAGH